MTMTVAEAKLFVSNAFPDYHVSFNPRLQAIIINYRDVEFSITKANDNGKQCYAVKKYDRTLAFEPYIVKFVDSMEEVVSFMRTYTNIFENMYIRLDLKI
jgi:hypothetical protein